MDYRKFILGCAASLAAATAFAGTEAATAPKPDPALQPPAASAATGASKPSPAATPSGKKAASPATTAPKKPAPAKKVKKVDINNATVAELRALPLSEAEAQRVIAHRPYRAKGELMTKAGMPEGVYSTVKNKLELQEPRKSAAAKK